MSETTQFFVDFLGQFFQGLLHIFTGLFQGIGQCLNIPGYVKIAKDYNGNVSVVVIVLTALLLLLLVAALVFAIVLLIRRKIHVLRTKGSREGLVAEVQNLSKEVMRLNLEKDKILSMKVSQIGLNPNEISTLTGEEQQTLREGEKEGKEGENGSRFYRLTQTDLKYAQYVPPVYDDQITLPQICDRFRDFCCSRLGLYYEPKIVRLFLASFASTRLIILQGISGTGKTSLPYAFGKFLENDSLIASVQPSWRDRSELFGYFNEFSGHYNETEFLNRIYEATYTDDIYLTILDEMNIARVEYYFAEMLSIMEMPSEDEWVIDLVPSVWESDPKHLDGGKLHLPGNMWYVGTANNDDSTFAITDKVYDRAMPIDINTKGIPFQAPDTEPLHISHTHLVQLLEQAKQDNVVSRDTLRKVELLDDYVIEHFRLAFGNRIVKQLKDFVPAYVGCGGTELDGLDYVLAKKVLRKFESMNLSFIRDEIDGLIDYLHDLFGEDSMGECVAYLQRLKKLV